MIRPFILKDISSYRSEVMGIAMIWIMMIHFDFTQLTPLGFISQFGFLGPDLFLFVSGFGLFFSLDKNNNLYEYFKKRIIRVFPTYYILGIIPSVVFYKDTLFDYLYRYTTIGFWNNDLYGDWYIPSAIMLYLWAPFIKKLFDKKLFLILYLLSIITIFLSFYLVDKDSIIDRPHFSFLHRIPSFLFGMTCAYWLKTGTVLKYYYIIVLLGLPLCAYLYPHHHQIYNYKNFSLTFLLPLVIVIFCLFLKRCIRIKILNVILSKIGEASLEIYLIQGIFFHAILTKMICVPPIWHDTLTISLIIISSIMGILFHWLVNKFRTIQFL